MATPTQQDSGAALLCRVSESRTLGNASIFAECQAVRHSATIETLPSVLDFGTRQRWDLCRVSVNLTLSNDWNVAECPGNDTRQRSQQCRVPLSLHSALLGIFFLNSGFVLFSFQQHTINIYHRPHIYRSKIPYISPSTANHTCLTPIHPSITNHTNISHSSIHDHKFIHHRIIPHIIHISIIT